MRVKNLVDWADGMKFVPEIIEDQYQAYKHPNENKVISKKKEGIFYIDDVKFKGKNKPAWLSQI